MPRLPTEIAPRLVAAQLLIERITPRPRTKFSRNGIRGNDLWLMIALTKAPRNRARYAADRKFADRRTDIAFPCNGAFKYQGVEICKVFAMHEWPAHVFSTNDTDRISFNGIVDKAPEHTPTARAMCGRSRRWSIWSRSGRRRCSAGISARAGTTSWPVALRSPSPGATWAAWRSRRAARSKAGSAPLLCRALTHTTALRNANGTRPSRSIWWATRREVRGLG